MNNQALRPVIATLCIATLTTTVSAMDTDLQKGPSDLVFGAELLNKQYDNGAVRNDDITAHGTFTGRWFDVGLHADAYMAIGEDKTQTPPTKPGTLTQINLGIDYLIEMEHWFQLLPHYMFTTYPNWSNVPYKDDFHWLGADAWFLLPFQGFEVGTSFDYNAFYDGANDKHNLGGWGCTHAMRGAVAARQFWQHAPVDLSFFEVLNLANGEYKHFLGAGTTDATEAGFTTLDVGMKYTAPFFINEFWTVARLEGHFWLEKDDRTNIRNANKDPNEIIVAVGFEWQPK